MAKCTRQGCQKDFDEGDNAEGSCSYHPGGPVFHEGLKSWSCCNEVNKPVMEFDAFMSIPPCTKGTHSTAPPPKPATTSNDAQASSGPSYVNEDGKEVYGAKPKPPTDTDSSSKPPATTAITPAAPAPAKVEIEEDDESVPVPEGSRCKRLGCGSTWEGEDISRGEGDKASCTFHPQSAIFHEGSKGYLCCKRRVLEFDEFMKIEGCTKGRHLFVGPKRDESKEELVSCRLDHYQTPTQVHVSAFAKGADKEKSKVSFEQQQLHLDLYLPSNKRIVKSVTLYGPIEPSDCTFRILSTKVDIVLVKPAATSWPVLELPPAGSELPPGYALTFGVSGRTGTVGGKEIVLAPEEMSKRQ